MKMKTRIFELNLFLSFVFKTWRKQRTLREIEDVANGTVFLCSFFQASQSLKSQRNKFLSTYFR